MLRPGLGPVSPRKIEIGDAWGLADPEMVCLLPRPNGRRCGHEKDDRILTRRVAPRGLRGLCGPGAARTWCLRGSAASGGHRAAALVGMGLGLARPVALMRDRRRAPACPGQPGTPSAGRRSSVDDHLAVVSSGFRRAPNDRIESTQPSLSGTSARSGSTRSSTRRRWWATVSPAAGPG